MVSWNAGAERIYGYTAEEMIGRSVSILIPSYRPEELPGILEKITRGEGVDDFETVRLRKDGTPVEVSLTISPIRDATGQVVGASTVTRDITRRKQEENERLKPDQGPHLGLDSRSFLIRLIGGARPSATVDRDDLLGSFSKPHAALRGGGIDAIPPGPLFKENPANIHCCL